VCSLRIVADYVSRTARSRAHFTRAGRVIPSGATRSLNSWPPHPVYLSAGSGSTVHDLDGNAYRDFLCNYTSLPFGHADPDVGRALREQLASGVSLSFSRTLEHELAELLVARIPSIQRVRFTGSGTEAMMFALRLARAFTGRPAIAKAEGGYHGTVEEVMVSVRPPRNLAGPANAPHPVAELQGTPASIVDNTVIVPFNDIEATETVLRANADRVAALVLEPVLGVGGMIPADGAYLVAVRRVCDELGILLIFDEVITLRLSVGGAQQPYGVRPDLTTMGKIIGGGMPLGAYGGRGDVMALLERGGQALYQGGTFTGNAMSLAAGIVTMDKLDWSTIATLNDTGQTVRDKLGAVVALSPVPATVTGVGSLFTVHAGTTRVRWFRDVWNVRGDLQHTLFLGLLNRGVILGPDGMGCVSTRTTAADVDQLVRAVASTLSAVEPRQD
jgi:glutamate-1-semialdehyde 2,1-aminomutase